MDTVSHEGTSIAVKDMLSFGWATFERRPWFFIGIIIILMVASGIVNAIITAVFGAQGAGSLFGNVASFLVNTLVSMGIANVFLKAHENVYSVQFADIWHPQPFLKFLGAYFLQSIIILVGFILLVVPGVIAMVMLAFTSYLVMEKGLGPIEAINESIRLTKGERWNLLILLVALIFVNLIGLLALLVGLLVTIPVSVLAIVHAYKTLSLKNPMPASSVAI